MCLAIEKMKEKGRREERMKSLKALEEEREKSSKALEEEREKSSKALDEEREKSLKALDEERKNGICNLIEGCRKLGENSRKNMPTADDLLPSDAERGVRLFERVLCLRFYAMTQVIKNS
ncbi:MAG: hypothetical protein K6G44_00170 [Lentisphaeria bacterium]|nr:hypothetical protein [Lentisphaeria bacterium]